MPWVYMIQSTKKIIEMLPNITDVLKLIIESFPLETLNDGWTEAIDGKFIWFLAFFFIKVTIKLMSKIVTQNPLNLDEGKSVINKTGLELTHSALYNLHFQGIYTNFWRYSWVIVEFIHYRLMNRIARSIIQNCWL